MNAKLTLSLDKDVIDKAKKYASTENMSLSKMVEAYLESITKTQNENQESETTPLVKRLSGVIKLPNDLDYKKEYGDYLMEKYK